MSISIAEPADGQGKILVISFTPEFQALTQSEQGREFAAYLQQLGTMLSDPTGVDERNRAGMSIVHQFSEQLLPHIRNGELALEERIVLQIRQEEQATALVDLLAREQNGA